MRLAVTTKDHYIFQNSSKSSKPAISAALAALILLSLVTITNLSGIPTASSQLQITEETGAFVNSKLADGLNFPTAMAFAPDGRLFVTELGGNVRIIKDGVLLDTPFLSVSPDTCCERGLLGIALDPDFATNGFVYVYYTTSFEPIHNRVSRFTADSGNTDIALLESEQPILDLDPLTPNFHNGGAIHFGKDGKLYVAVGDNYIFENAQMLTTRLGKMLRINSDGSIPTDNPFYNATGARKEIWALGLRNPFTIAFSPADGRMFINDVGHDWAEEINAGAAGANYGWPRCEGACLNPDFVNPTYAYTHEDGFGKAITGGAFYEADQFPAKYKGSYFFGDYVLGFIKRLTPDGQVTDFQDAFSPIDIDVGPDGSLYYLSIGSGAVYRVQFAEPKENGIPVAVAVASLASGTPPLEVTFDGSGSSDPEQDNLAYSWDFGDGSEIANGTIVKHAYDSAGFYVAKLVVDDGKGGVSSATVDIVVGNAPAGIINLPTKDERYNGGDVIFFSGSANDVEDGNLPDSAFSWEILLHHNTHTHPFLRFDGVRDGNFTIPRVMETASDVWFQVSLTVKDSAGLSSVYTTDIYPNRVGVVLESNTPAIQINLDGQPKTAPHSFIGVTGITRTIEAPIEQMSDGRAYRFQSWSDGGEPMHTIDTPSGNTTYTVNYVPVNSTLTIRSLDMDGNNMSGMWAVVSSLDGTVLQTGFTPLEFTGNSGQEYMIAMEKNFDGIAFDRWEDGNNDAARTVPLSSSEEDIVAYYDVTLVEMGFTSIAHKTGQEDTVLTIQAVSPEGPLNMWTMIRPGPEGVNIMAFDYANLVFDHWEDGSTARTRTLTIDENTTITAHYVTTTG